MSKRIPATILIVEAEDVFSECLMHFPAGRYALLFAVGAAEAMALVETRTPKLIILPMAGAMAGLAEALVEISREETTILGLSDEDSPDTAVPEGITRVVYREDTDQITAAASALLKERRKQPRVVVEFPVRLGAGGTAIARDLSASAIQIQTALKLERGSEVLVEIGWGDEPRQFSTTVYRADRTLLGDYTCVLNVVDEPETRDYLDRLVKKILEVEHYLQGTSRTVAPLRGPVAWNLARRTEDTLHDAKTIAGKAPAAEDTPPSTATELESRYKLQSKIGRWGVGDVWEGTHRLLNRQVLVKVLAEELRDAEPARARIEQEARVASALVCDQVVDVLDFGHDGEGGLYYAMEFLRGQTLAEAVAADQELTPLEITRIGIDVARALTKAHEQKLGHHDLCPDHIYLAKGDDNEVSAKLLSFGGELPMEALESPYVQGTAYWPPEAASTPPGPAYDIYGLGAVLYDVLAASNLNAPKSITSPEEPSTGERKLREVLKRARASSRADRFLSMASMEEALQQCLEVFESEPDEQFHRIVSSSMRTIDLDNLSERTALDDITIPWPAAKLRAIADRADEIRRNAAPKAAAPRAELIDAGLYSYRKPTPAEQPAIQPHKAPKSSRPQTQLLSSGRNRDVAQAQEPAAAIPEPSTGLAMDRGAPGRSAAASKAMPSADPKKAAGRPPLLGVPTPIGKPAAADAPAPHGKAKARVPAGLRGRPASGGISRGIGKPMPLGSLPPLDEPDLEQGLPPAPAPLPPSVQPTAAPVLPPTVAPASATRERRSAAVPVVPSAAKAPLPFTPTAPLEAPALELPTGFADTEVVDTLPVAPGLPAVEPAVPVAPMVPEPEPPADGFDPSMPLAEAEDELLFQPAAVVPMPVARPMAMPPPPTDKRRLILIGGAAAGGVLILLLIIFLWPSSKPAKHKDRRSATHTPSAMRPAPQPMRVPPMRAEPAMAEVPDAAVLTPEGPPDAAVPSSPDAAAMAPAATSDAGASTADDPNAGDKGLTPKEKRNQLMARAQRLIRRGRYAESRKFLTYALKIDDSARLRRYFSTSYERLGQIWPAIYHLNKAIKMSPRNAGQRVKIGQLYLRVGQRGNACGAFRTALRFKPGNDAAKRQLQKHCK
ncbi:MAG: protein kinase [bacterium]